MSDDFPPVLDAEMVARLLHLNTDTVRRKTREGELPAHTIGPNGRAYRYLRDEILAWLAEQPAPHEVGPDVEADGPRRR